MGDIDCTHRFIDPLMDWADGHGVSYMGWSWIKASCKGEPSLIKSYNGAPTRYGVGLRDHLVGLQQVTDDDLRGGNLNGLIVPQHESHPGSEFQ